MAVEVTLAIADLSHINYLGAEIPYTPGVAARKRKTFDVGIRVDLREKWTSSGNINHAPFSSTPSELISVPVCNPYATVIGKPASKHRPDSHKEPVVQ